MTSNRLHTLLKAGKILLKLIFSILIQLGLWVTALHIVEEVISSSDTITHYIEDLTPATRKVFSLKNLKGLIGLFYMGALLIQTLIWIKYTIQSLINNSDKQINKRFYRKENKRTELAIRRPIAFMLDIAFLTICLLPLTILWRYFFPNNLWVLFWIYPFLKGIYFVYFEQSKKQASLGKILLKLKIVNIKGDRLSIKTAIVRYLFFFCMPLSYKLIKTIFPAKLNYTAGVLAIIIWTISIFFTKKQATLYDILSKTRVTKISK